MTQSLTSKPVLLTEYIKRGSGDKKQTIKEVTLRRPKSGELRGLRLVEIANADVSSLITLVPRISQPALTEQDMSDMNLADFSSLAVEVAGFLEPKNATQ